MRSLVCLCVLAVVTSAASARADEPPPTDDWHAAFQKQQVELDALRAAFDKEQKDRQDRLAPQVKVSGFVQVDWIVHNQSSQDEINGSTGAPLNQDRFELRRGHVRLDAEKGLVLGAIEVDANKIGRAHV